MNGAVRKPSSSLHAFDANRLLIGFVVSAIHAVVSAPVWHGYPLGFMLGGDLDFPESVILVKPNPQLPLYD